MPFIYIYIAMRFCILLQIFFLLIYYLSHDQLIATTWPFPGAGNGFMIITERSLKRHARILTLQPKGNGFVVHFPDVGIVTACAAFEPMPNDIFACFFFSPFFLVPDDHQAF